jgi:hypothetical protein
MQLDFPKPTVAFGSRVTFRRDDGRVQKYYIVGEDEADPKAGSISFVSPVARLLMDKAVGDVVGTSGQELEIVAISQHPRTGRSRRSECPLGNRSGRPELPLTQADESQCKPRRSLQGQRTGQAALRGTETSA